MEQMLKGKVVVLTGAGRGIGKATALYLGRQGARLVVNNRVSALPGGASAPSSADQVVAEIRQYGGEAVANYDTIGTPEAAENIVQTALSHFGGLDVLVNVANFHRKGMPWDMSDEDWDALIRVNVYGYFYCSRAALRVMRERIADGRQSSGRIINFTSHSGLMGSPARPAYCTAKGGIVGLTYGTAIDLAGSGITCNAIAPHALTLTDEMARQEVPDEQILQVARNRGIGDASMANIELLRRQILGGEPETIAPLVAWLASDQSQHVNGEIFHLIDGTLSVIAKPEEKRAVRQSTPFTFDDISRAMETLVHQTNHV